MENITTQFNEVFEPYKGFVVFKNASDGDALYTESFDFTKDGKPINFHPLTHDESFAFTKTVIPDNYQTGFLHCHSLLPDNVLYTNIHPNGSAMWYTRQAKQPLYFKESLHIPSGTAHMPALLWYATNTSLQIFALIDDNRPVLTTQLYHAPFFNISGRGEVCMGDVKLKFSPECGLIEFMESWQKYFFNSHFSHLILKKSPVKGNITQLWKERINTAKKFPNDRLLPTSVKIKTIINDIFQD